MAAHCFRTNQCFVSCLKFMFVVISKWSQQQLCSLNRVWLKKTRTAYCNFNIHTSSRPSNYGLFMALKLCSKMWMKEEENEQRQQWGGHIASELEALRTYLFGIYLLILGLIKWCYSLCLHLDRKFLNKVGNIIESQKIQNLQETICVK